MPILSTIAAFSTRGFGGGNGVLVGTGWINVGASSNLSLPDGAYAISMNSSNNIIVPGYRRVPDPTTGFVDRGVLTIMTENGESPATTTFSSGNSIINSSVVDSSDNIYVSGRISATSQSDGMLAKYNSVGDLQWVQSIGGAGVETSVDVDVTSTGNAYVCLTAFTSPNYVLYFLKYNSSGTRQWVRSLSPISSGYQAVICNIVDSSGSVYTLINRSNSGMLIKMDSSGNTVWSRVFDVPGVTGWNSAMSISDTTLYVGVDAGFLAIDTTTGNIITQRKLDIDSSAIDIITTQFDNLGNIYCLAYLPGPTPSMTSSALVYSFDSSGNLRYCNKLSQDTTYPVEPLIPTGMVYKNGNLYITFNNSGYDLVVMKVPAKGSIPGKGVYIMPLNGLAATYTFDYHPYSVSGATTTYTSTSISLTFGTTGLTDSMVGYTTDPLELVWTRKSI